MKKAIFFTLCVLYSICAAFGQDTGGLKFLGIPIDGNVTQFSAKLKSKGFIYNSVTESYKGEFNGKDVDVYIHTNHNKVDRVYVAFPLTSEESIRVDYNKLLSQFRKNGKYTEFFNEEIPKDEDISYEISVKNKRYQASFLYFDPSRDKLDILNSLLEGVSSFFTREQYSFIKEKIDSVYGLPKDERETAFMELREELMGSSINQSFDEQTTMDFFIAVMDRMESIADGSVWFMIHEYYGSYQIGLYYDNLHNQPHGEDL